MILDALQKAESLHKGQFRKGTKIPYFVHILDVANILMNEDEISDDIICAGILHDTLEDTIYSKEELRRDFGENIYSLVNFCTEPGNNFNSSKEESIKSWKQRKKHSIESLILGNEMEVLIFLADKYSNLKSIKEDLILSGDNVWKKFNSSYDDIKWYYTTIREVAEKKIPNRRTYRLFGKLVDDVFKSN